MKTILITLMILLVAQPALAGVEAPSDDDLIYDILFGWIKSSKMWTPIDWNGIWTGMTEVWKGVLR
jgi:hypothetical protein